MRGSVGLLIGLIPGALSFGYRVETGSIAAAVVIAIAYAIGWSSTLKLAANVAERCNAIAAAFALPAAWAAIDTLLIHLSPHGSIGSLAYSQSSLLSIQQLASLGGVPLITFVVLLPGSAVAIILAFASGKKSIRLLPQAISIAILVSVAAISFGFARLNTAPPPTGPVVVMISADKIKGARRDWMGFVDTYGAILDGATRPGVTILLPEKILRVDKGELKQAQMALSALARERAATIVIGLVVDNGQAGTNRALAFLPDGTTSTYIKQHLIPGLEGDLVAGHQDLLINQPVVATGIAICKDMHFPALGRNYALKGTKLMLVPAYDFDVDANMLMRVTAMRGIEGGYTVARTARDGLSSVTDAYGRIVAQRRSDEKVGQLTSQLPQALSAPPLYAQIGDLFGWLCLLAWIGIYMLARLKRVSSLSVTN